VLTNLFLTSLSISDTSRLSLVGYLALRLWAQSGILKVETDWRWGGGLALRLKLLNISSAKGGEIYMYLDMAIHVPSTSKGGLDWKLAILYLENQNIDAMDVLWRLS